MINEQKNNHWIKFYSNRVHLSAAILYTFPAGCRMGNPAWYKHTVQHHRNGRADHLPIFDPKEQ